MMASVHGGEQDDDDFDDGHDGDGHDDDDFDDGLDGGEHYDDDQVRSLHRFKKRISSCLHR